MSEVARFIAEVQENIEGLRTDAAVRQATINWVNAIAPHKYTCLLYTSPSPRDKRQSRMPSSA